MPIGPTPSRFTLFLLLCAALCVATCAQRQKILIDTDIGDDIDDAYALALALHSPELEVLGVTTAWGDTALRARLAARLIAATDAGKIPVLAGIPTHGKAAFSQRAWALAGPAPSHADAVDFLLAQAKRYPTKSRSSPLDRLPTSLPLSRAIPPPSACCVASS